MGIHQTTYRRVIGIGIGFGIALLHLSVGIHLPVNLFLVSSLAFTLFALRQISLTAVATLIIIHEIISPLAPLRYSAALVLALLFFFIFMRRYFTHRSLLGVTVGVITTALIFELLLLVAGTLFTPETAAWRPVMDSSYLRFLGVRILSTTIAMVGIFLCIQHFSPKIRGIIVTRA